MWCYVVCAYYPCFYVDCVKKIFKFVRHVEIMEESRKAYKI